MYPPVKYALAPFAYYTIIVNLSCCLCILLPFLFLPSFLKLDLNLVFLHIYFFLDKYWFKKRILLLPVWSLLRFVVANNRIHLHYFKQNKKFTKGSILHHGVSVMARESSLMALYSQSPKCSIAPLHWATCCGLWMLQETRLWQHQFNTVLFHSLCPLPNSCLIWGTLKRPRSWAYTLAWSWENNFLGSTLGRSRPSCL